MTPEGASKLQSTVGRTRQSHSLAAEEESQGHVRENLLTCVKSLVLDNYVGKCPPQS